MRRHGRARVAVGFIRLSGFGHRSAAVTGSATDDGARTRVDRFPGDDRRRGRCPSRQRFSLTLDLRLLTVLLRLGAHRVGLTPIVSGLALGAVLAFLASPLLSFLRAAIRL